VRLGANHVWNPWDLMAQRFFSELHRIHRGATASAIASRIVDMMCDRILARPGYYMALVGQNFPDAPASEADDAGDATVLDAAHLFDASAFPEPADITRYMWATLCIPRWAATYVLEPFARRSACHYMAMAIWHDRVTHELAHPLAPQILSGVPEARDVAWATDTDPCVKWPDKTVSWPVTFKTNDPRARV
jgi:hypothetical protein